MKLNSCNTEMVININTDGSKDEIDFINVDLEDYEATHNITELVALRHHLWDDYISITINELHICPALTISTPPKRVYTTLSFS